MFALVRLFLADGFWAGRRFRQADAISRLQDKTVDGVKERDED
jgi:hypothetical protein